MLGHCSGITGEGGTPAASATAAVARAPAPPLHWPARHAPHRHDVEPDGHADQQGDRFWLHFWGGCELSAGRGLGALAAD